MRKIGELFRIKISPKELSKELTPKFGEVIDRWIRGVFDINYARPEYIKDITYITKSLRIFVSRVLEALDRYAIIGGALERGFGFGKTHSLIFLWSVLNSGEFLDVVDLSINKELVSSTLVLGIDFTFDKPFAMIIKLLEAYTKVGSPLNRVKDPKLVAAIDAVLGRAKQKGNIYDINPSDLAELILAILKEYRNRGGNPRLLILVDELGVGILRRLSKWIDKKTREAYVEITDVLRFLQHLYFVFQNESFSTVVIWVLAEQDRRMLQNLINVYADNKSIGNAVKGVITALENLADRYSRGYGGISIAELTYSIEQAIEIARYRTLQFAGDNWEDAVREFIRMAEKKAQELNLMDEFTRYRGYLEKYYPFSPGLIALLKKVMNAMDCPGTEFVRTILQIVANAAIRALRDAPLDSYLIGLNHLDLSFVVLTKLLGSFGDNWAYVAADMNQVVEGISDTVLKSAAEHVMKFLLAKGATANIISFFENRDESLIARYGSTFEELQLDILLTYSEEKAFDMIGRLNDAVEKLKAESARIEVHELHGRTYLLPSIVKTVFDRLASYILDEKKEVFDEYNRINLGKVPIYLSQTDVLGSILSKASIIVDGNKDIVLAQISFDLIISVDSLVNMSIVRDAQKRGNLLLLVVPPWDVKLFGLLNIDNKNYDEILLEIINNLNDALRRGQISRFMHIVVLVPDIRKERLRPIIERLTIFIGTKKFLDDLSKTKAMIDNKLEEVMTLIIKREDIDKIFGKKSKEALKKLIEKQIEDAKLLAQKQLITISRRLVADVISLYDKVIYFSIDSNKFEAKSVSDLAIDHSRSLEKMPSKAKYTRPDAYADIVGKFFANIIKRLGYTTDITVIKKILLKQYEDEFKRFYVREYDRIDDIIENLMAGVFQIKPLSARIAEKAINLLNNSEIILEDSEERTVKVRISVDGDSRLVRFEKLIIPKEKKQLILEKAPPLPQGEKIVETVPREPVARPDKAKVISISLDPSNAPPNLASDIVSRLENINAYEIAGIKVFVKSASYELEMKTRVFDDESKNALIMLINIFVLRIKKPMTLTIEVRKPIEKDVLEAMLKGYKFKFLRTSFDRFLPE